LDRASFFVFFLEKKDRAAFSSNGEKEKASVPLRCVTALTRQADGLAISAESERPRSPHARHIDIPVDQWSVEHPGHGH
jgi:hypothetical protein